jgi:hypothetical protein
MPAPRGIPGDLEMQTHPFAEVRALSFDMFSIVVAGDFLDWAARMGAQAVDHFRFFSASTRSAPKAFQPG